MRSRPVAYASTSVIPGKRLRLVALPPEQDVTVGQIFSVSADIDSTDPAEAVIAFPEELFELLSEGPTVSVPAGATRADWTLYCKRFSAEPVVLRIHARTASLQQLADIRVRINADADS